MNKNIIIKLEHGNTSQKSNEGLKIQRISSSISPYHFIRMVGVADNKINPRAARENGITSDIRETLTHSSNLFWLMSKGILIATENCKILDRGRISITTDGDREGIMDGGHNALAISQFLIAELFPDIKIFKTWTDCKEFWNKNEKEIITRFNDKGGNDAFNFSIPIEIIFPSEEDGALDEYYETISQICTARNTNVQLKQATQDNQVGIYEILKKHLTCADKVVWKSGQSGDIKVEDVVSMAVIPLIFLQEQGLLPNKNIKTLNPISVYSQKSKCVDFYGDVLKHPEISSKQEDKYILKNSLVHSALEMVDDIIRAFDNMYITFPDIHNSNAGKFGRIGAVDQKKTKSVKVPFLTTTQKTDYKYSAGFFLPLFCGIRKLMYVDETTNTLKWKKNPADKTFDFHDLKCAKYIEMVKFLQYDPNKVGKASMMYLEGLDVFASMLNNNK
ncbi:MAG: hypothetical protein IKM23_05280 [Bacteroidales bacterium]|nr:hypothetical protein [Bacteroidales bacterium]